jgi:hypothetical protein
VAFGEDCGCGVVCAAVVAVGVGFLVGVSVGGAGVAV